MLVGRLHCPLLHPHPAEEPLSDDRLQQSIRHILPVGWWCLESSMSQGSWLCGLFLRLQCHLHCYRRDLPGGSRYQHAWAPCSQVLVNVHPSLVQRALPPLLASSSLSWRWNLHGPPLLDCQLHSAVDAAGAHRQAPRLMRVFVIRC